jgi:hypothetical protein
MDNPPLDAGNPISSLVIMFSTNCRIIGRTSVEFAADPELTP